MKILYIITQADGGGAQKYTLTLAKHFNGIIAAGNESSHLFTAAEDLQLTTYNLQHLKRNISPLNDILAIWEIRQLIKQIQPDIVHLNSSKAGILGSFASIFTKTKVVFTAHGFVFNEPLNVATKSFYLALEKVASDFRDFIITVSDADKNSALNNKIINSGKITTIHNGLEEIDFLSKEQAINKLGINPNKIIIGSTSNFYKTKGLDVLIDAISQMDEAIKAKIEVVLIGSGPEDSNLKLKIENLKLGNTVKMLGKIEDAGKYIKAFDVFVMPSRKEGFPYAILEAMQAGLPIVASNTGGIVEALADAGFLVDPENPEELKLVLSKIINDLNIHGEKYFMNLSQKARLRAAGFSKEKMLAETEKVYETVLTA